MSERQPYSRVYWSVLEDEKFNEIRTDLRLFGAWTLMLVVADMAYPSPAFVPPTVPKRAQNALVGVGLVELLPGSLYRVCGLKRERERRALAATRGPNRVPTAPQAGPKRDPDGRVDEDETRRDETSTDTARATDPADVYWTLTGRYPTDKVLRWVDDLAASYGPEAVIRALAGAHQADSSSASLLGRTQDALRAEARALSLKDQATVRASLKERRAVPPKSDAELRAEREAINAEVRRLMEPGAAA